MKKSKLSRILSILSAVCALALLVLLRAGSVYAEEGGQEEDGSGELVVNNGIPVLYLNIDETRGTVQEMHDSSDHSVYCYGTFRIDVPEGFRYADYPDTDLSSIEEVGMSIRGRGNSTWKMSNKKPYKIKLDDNKNVLGVGVSKHWVLIANDFDPTLMKDRITGWLGDAMGFAWTPRGVPVDVVMTGQEFGTAYLGSYYLSENVRVDEDRVNIAKLKEKDTDAAVITGGYLLQNALQVRTGSPDRFYTSRGVDWATNTPSFDVEADALSASPEEGEEAFIGRELGDGYKNNDQQAYIQNYMQQVEDILFDGTTKYRDYVDVESSAKYWLVNVVSLNGDAFATGSTYIYKDRDPEDGVSKLYWGPLWDFDFAWGYGNPEMEFSDGHKWMLPMFCDREEGGFVEAIGKYWPEMRTALKQLSDDGGLIDQYRDEILESARANHEKYEKDKPFTFEEDVEKLKLWIRNRIDWVDENFDQIDGLVHKVTYMADGEVYKLDFLSYRAEITGREPWPEKEGRTFLGWEDEDGNLIESPFRTDRDITLTARYAPDDSMTHAEDIAFSKSSDIIYNSMMVKIYQIPYTVIPEDAEDNRVIWTSSDKNLASVDENGQVRYTGPGEVTFTAELHLGKTRQFTLTILPSSSDPLPCPEEIFPEEEEIAMTVGDLYVFRIRTEPEPSKIHSYEYESEDPDVVTVGEYGVLTAVGPGTARVLVRAEVQGADYEMYNLETYTTVTVTEEGPEPTGGPTPGPTGEPSPGGDPTPTEEPTPTPSGGPTPVPTVSPASAEYRVESVSPSSWTKGSSTGVRITVKRSEADDACFSHFTGVKLDGKTLSRDEDYTAASGSTIVDIKAAVLQKLSTGSHTITIEFDDGKAETKIEIRTSGGKGGGSSNTPGTGDDSHAAGYALLLVASLGIMIALILRKKRRPKP